VLLLMMKLLLSLLLLTLLLLLLRLRGCTLCLLLRELLCMLLRELLLSLLLLLLLLQSALLFLLLEQVCEHILSHLRTQQTARHKTTKPNMSAHGEDQTAPSVIGDCIQLPTESDPPCAILCPTNMHPVCVNRQEHCRQLRLTPTSPRRTSTTKH
jgi:hypothetical protein